MKYLHKKKLESSGRLIVEIIEVRRSAMHLSSKLAMFKPLERAGR